MKPGANELALEDRILWAKVAETAHPLRGKAAVRVEAAEDDPADAPVGRAAVVAAPGAAAGTSGIQTIDRTSHRKLARGQLAIGATVDLHGLTQDEAHGFLLSFLRRAHSRGMRYVLVITGKGSSTGGMGVLRRAVPQWMATKPFRAFVSAYEDAARVHGGSGALYVRLRRRAGSTRPDLQDPET